jgi:hypothetical protein
MIEIPDGFEVKGKLGPTYHDRKMKNYTKTLAELATEQTWELTLMDVIVKKTSNMAGELSRKARADEHIESDPLSPRDDGLSCMDQEGANRDGGQRVRNPAAVEKPHIGRTEVLTSVRSEELRIGTADEKRGIKRGSPADLSDGEGRKRKTYRPCYEAERSSGVRNLCDGKQKCGRCEDKRMRCVRSNCPQGSNCTRSGCSRMHPGEWKELKSPVGVKNARFGDAECHPPGTPASGS